MAIATDNNNSNNSNGRKGIRMCTPYVSVSSAQLESSEYLHAAMRANENLLNNFAKLERRKLE